MKKWQKISKKKVVELYELHRHDEGYVSRNEARR